MEDKGRKNISDTFEKYNRQSPFGVSSGNINQPKNVSSSMWEPISGGSNLQTPEKIKTDSEKVQKNQAGRPISEGRAPDSAKKVQNKQNSKKTSQVKKKKKEPEKGKNIPKSRTPKGKPVSQKMDDRAPSQRKKQNVSDKRSSQTKDMRHNQQLKKNTADYDRQINEGKSPTEISRRRARDKRKRRRIRSIITVIVFLVFVGAFIGVYSYSKGAPIANIVVEGESIYKNEKIIETSGIEVGLNMLSIREKAVNKQLTKQLPYIHSVDIKRQLPDTVIITVTPTTEKYLIVNDKGFICVDENEKILADKKKKLHDGSFKINGLSFQQIEVGEKYEPEGDNLKKYELAKEIADAILNKGTMKKAVINVSDITDVKVMYNSKVMIYLGDCKDLQNRINLASDVISEAASQGQTGYIDTRYDGRAYFNEGTMKID